MIPNKNNKVLIGLSGGVDSTAAVLILQREGFDVTGLFFSVQTDETKTAQEARAVAKELGIKFLHKDVSRRFKDSVIRYFCEEYKNGRTPNPCVMCNETMKFQILRETADEIGAFYIATGHYAKIKKTVLSGDSGKVCFFIQQGANKRKDQSYMLYRLGDGIRSRLILPLGDLSSKEEVRQIAHEHNMQNAEKKDSQEICFIRDESYIDFLKKQGYTGCQGDFVDQNGRVIGKHKGTLHYTVGQRKGLGATFGRPMFVTKVDSKKNMVTLGDDKDLFSHVVYSRSHVYASCPPFATVDNYNGKGAGEATDGGFVCRAKIRYTAPLADCKVFFQKNDVIKTVFDQPQRAATPGQSIVFYYGDIVIGGGVIESTA